jgi:ComF family protein
MSEERAVADGRLPDHGAVEAVFSSSQQGIPVPRVNLAGARSPLPVAFPPSSSQSPQSFSSWVQQINKPPAWPRAMMDGLFTVLFPSDCRVCTAPLTTATQLPVCGDCLGAMAPLTANLCLACGDILPDLPQYAGESRCGLCRRVELPFARAASYGSYEGGLRHLIHLLKYENVLPAADYLGRMLADVVREIAPGFGSDPVLLLPVPLHRAKLRGRGFNQAERVARAAVRHLPDVRLEIVSRDLLRQRETASQAGLTQHARRENVRGAFRVSRPQAVAGREVLLVDDVYTTGATVAECARVLRKAGASSVFVATVARTLKASAAAAMPKGPARVELFDTFPRAAGE